jgi:hypothetical protein
MLAVVVEVLMFRAAQPLVLAARVVAETEQTRILLLETARLILVAQAVVADTMFQGVPVAQAAPASLFFATQSLFRP